jgi:phosphoribosylaminoimidazole-succinocarboxamide synthase
MSIKIDFGALTKIAEGKTKIIYANPDSSMTVFMRFKSDITAGDGVKHDIIPGKAPVDWQINRDIFEFLNRYGVRTHYITSPQEEVCLVCKLDRKINLEVISRRVATGSILKWGKAIEGTWYDPPITQFHYKDDPLHDPMLDDSYLDYLIGEKHATEYQKMREMNIQVFLLLEKAFAQSGLQLLDMKLEYGIINSQVDVIDEITGGSFRLWPYRHKNPNLNQPNVMSELDPQARLDKDTYRMGEDLESVLTKFKQIARITAQFRTLTI